MARYIWVIDQVCSVKIAGYWPSSFFCVLMNRDEVEVQKLAKKRTRPMSSLIYMATIVRAIGLAAERALFSCNDRAL